MRRVEAPFDGDTINHLILFQSATHVYPYTCLRHSDRPLAVSRDGLHCMVPECGYHQTWAFLAPILNEFPEYVDPGDPDA